MVVFNSSFWLLQMNDWIDRFSTIRKKMISIRKTVDEIDKELEGIEGNVKTLIERWSEIPQSRAPIRENIFRRNRRN